MMRSMALAHAFCGLGKVEFILGNGCGRWANTILESGYHVVFDSDIGEGSFYDLCIMDMYNPSSDLLDRMRLISKKIGAFIDDVKLFPVEVCDFVIAPSCFAEEFSTSLGDQQLFLGPKYACIKPIDRENFVFRFSEKVRNIVVSCGYLDSAGINIKALNALKLAGFKGKVCLLVGSHSPYLNEASNYFNSVDYELEIIADCENVYDYLADADFAIGSGGISLFERLLFRLPSVTIINSFNQIRNVGWAQETGASLCMNSQENDFETELLAMLVEVLAYPQHRLKMYQNSFGLVDGKGAGRIVKMVF